MVTDLRQLYLRLLRRRGTPVPQSSSAT
jgi:hypothetical protein